ncbi:hypothetical protein HAX54_045775, partial [Datura stramonium]|nr:hypothetical protein [Datura stramonium]
KHHKEISDDDDMVKQEIGVEIQKSEINLMDLKIDDELIRGKPESKHERINAKDLILPDGWASEILVRVKGNSFGNKDA